MKLHTYVCTSSPRATVQLLVFQLDNFNLMPFQFNSFERDAKTQGRVSLVTRSFISGGKLQDTSPNERNENFVSRNQINRAREGLKKRVEYLSVDAIVVVGNQFQVVVQAQGAHEQTRAPRIAERRGASQVYTRDHCEAAHAEPTMEREVSFVSSPLGTFFFFFFLFLLSFILLLPFYPGCFLCPDQESDRERVTRNCCVGST